LPYEYLSIAVDAALGYEKSLKGNIAHLRVTKGANRYSGEIIDVPTAPFNPFVRVLNGWVVGSDRKPVSRLIRAYSRTTGAFLTETASDPVTGGYTVGLPAGDYTLIVNGEGGEPDKVRRFYAALPGG
jgi:hypothetical protein